MASAFTKTPILRTAAVRGYAAQCVPVAGSTTYDVKTSHLSNKMIVASAENDSPITRVSILFRAGSSNETPDNLGVTHVLRVAAGTATRSWSQFAIARRVAQHGATITCTTDREVVAYTLEGTRKAVAECIPFLTSVASEQVFHPWEVADQSNRIRLELATRPPQLRAIDLLHKAAYRTGLGNSLYIAKYNIGKISSETLQHYVAQNFTANRTAVVGVGINHQELEGIASSLQLQSGKDNVGNYTYKGGEIRSDKGGDMAYIAIATEGAAVSRQKEALAFAVLQRALGAGPSVKHGLESGSILGKASVDLSGPYALGAINVSYSNSGLFGVLVATHYASAKKILPTVVNALKSGSVSAKDIGRAKNQLITELMCANESGGNAISRIGQEAVLTSNAQSPCELVHSIDEVSESDVNAAAKKVASSRLTIAAVGNLSCVPFLEEL